jgi:3'-phosphoadenosine 5'-phosphosulfate sulfotransferase (PAPS reductase)/FAD synthetase
MEKSLNNKLYVCMFSSGRTSAILAKHLKENPHKYPNVIYVFLNTGRELEKSLIFADKCDKEFGLNLIWLEASVNYDFVYPGFGRMKCDINGLEDFKEMLGENYAIGLREFDRDVRFFKTGTTYTIVNFETASRNGEPFEAMLKKYPLPNNMASNCTRELKQRPIDAYLRDNFKNMNIIRAIGIRADEAHRKSIHAKEENIIYPLCDELPMNQRMVREFWEKQSFDLGLKDYEGNCDLCFKKSLKKRLTIIKDNPSIAEWWQRMEETYAFEDVPRFDLRTNKSIEELVEMAQRPFTKAEDLHELSKQQQELFEFETDCFCKSS